MKWNLIIVITVSFFIYACNTQAADVQPKETRELPVLKLSAKDTLFHQHYVADIQALKNVEIRSRTEGFLEKIYVEEGSKVKKGQLNV